MLLGKPDTKRTHYLERAAREAGLHVLFLDWDGWKKHFPEGKIFLKIDPPMWDCCLLDQLPGLAMNYLQCLGELERLKACQDVMFFNHPSAIKMLLDKKECKNRLKIAGLAVTEDLTEIHKPAEKKELAEAKGPAQPAVEKKQDRIKTPEQLLAIMGEKRIFQVFLKPVYGSGAAGAAALRLQPQTGKMVLYTCAGETSKDGTNCLVNTKQLQRFTDSRQVLCMLEKLLRLGCIVERWYAKADYQGYSYDLRAVVQDGRMDFCLARLSKGPITNLHLNNHPLELDALGLSHIVMEEIQDLCQRSMKLFPGLRSAGIDILLERGSLKPRIIEMNAQGDLIYQDIYGKNVIYRRQAEMMRAACSEE